MTMEEQRLSELLKRSVPEPPFELSADRVTVQHIDRFRRSWLMPALAAAAVVLVAGAGVGLNATQHPSPTSPSVSSAQRKVQVTLTPKAASTTERPAEAPASFNPLVLPVNFGWLPAGFSENQPSPDQFTISSGPLGVTPTHVSFGASAADGRGLAVTVAARGASVNPWTSGTGKTAVTGTAPDINGRPAKWIAGGLEWEYANGGWATLITGGDTSQEAQAAWGRHCTMDIPKGNGSKSPIANPKQNCAPYAPQSAPLRALLEKVASNLTWTPQPFTFPYEFTHPLPAGWTVGNVTGNFVNGRLIAGDMYLDPPTSPGAQLNTDGALDIQSYNSSTTHTYCAGLVPTTRFATYNGVKWGIGADHTSAMACSGTPVDEHGGAVSVGFDPNTVHGSPLGAAGVRAVLPLLKFLGPNPGDWTTSPLAK
jgi:hypothetical protein